MKRCRTFILLCNMAYEFINATAPGGTTPPKFYKPLPEVITFLKEFPDLFSTLKKTPSFNSNYDSYEQERVDTLNFLQSLSNADSFDIDEKLIILNSLCYDNCRIPVNFSDKSCISENFNGVFVFCTTLFEKNFLQNLADCCSDNNIENSFDFYKYIAELACSYNYTHKRIPFNELPTNLICSLKAIIQNNDGKNIFLKNKILSLESNLNNISKLYYNSLIPGLKVFQTSLKDSIIKAGTTEEIKQETKRLLTFRLNSLINGYDLNLLNTFKSELNTDFHNILQTIKSSKLLKDSELKDIINSYSIMMSYINIIFALVNNPNNLANTANNVSIALYNLSVNIFMGIIRNVKHGEDQDIYNNLSSNLAAKEFLYKEKDLYRNFDVSFYPQFCYFKDTFSDLENLANYIKKKIDKFNFPQLIHFRDITIRTISYLGSYRIAIKVGNESNNLIKLENIFGVLNGNLNAKVGDKITSNEDEVNNWDKENKKCEKVFKAKSFSFTELLKHYDTEIDNSCILMNQPNIMSYLKDEKTHMVNFLKLLTSRKDITIEKKRNLLAAVCEDFHRSRNDEDLNGNFNDYNGLINLYYILKKNNFFTGIRNFRGVYLFRNKEYQIRSEFNFFQEVVSTAIKYNFIDTEIPFAEFSVKLINDLQILVKKKENELEDPNKKIIFEAPKHKNARIIFLSDDKRAEYLAEIPTILNSISDFEDRLKDISQKYIALSKGSASIYDLKNNLEKDNPIKALNKAINNIFKDQDFVDLETMGLELDSAFAALLESLRKIGIYKSSKIYEIINNSGVDNIFYSSDLYNILNDFDSNDIIDSSELHDIINSYFIVRSCHDVMRSLKDYCQTTGSLYNKAYTFKFQKYINELSVSILMSLIRNKKQTHIYKHINEDLDEDGVKKFSNNKFTKFLEFEYITQYFKSSNNNTLILKKLFYYFEDQLTKLNLQELEQSLLAIRRIYATVEYHHIGLTFKQCNELYKNTDTERFEGRLLKDLSHHQQNLHWDYLYFQHPENIKIISLFFNLKKKYAASLKFLKEQAARNHDDNA